MNHSIYEAHCTAVWTAFEMHLVDLYTLFHEKKDVQLKAMKRPCWHWAGLRKSIPFFTLQSISLLETNYTIIVHVRCFSETRLWFASNLNSFYNSVKPAHCIFGMDAHYSAYKQNEGDSYLSVYLLGLIHVLTRLLHNCQQPQGGRGVMRGVTEA